MHICVYGSASKLTPNKYLDAATEVGELIAKAGHVCINGAGANGVMGALNRALLKSGGQVIGVVHEKMVDGDITGLETAGMELRLARGPTLEERKRMLAESAEGFIALPGGPGTFEELWEVASLESLRLLTEKARARPVILVNTDGFYSGFIMQLLRAHTDGLLRVEPDDVIKVVSTPAEAMACLTDQKVFSKMTPLADMLSRAKAKL